VAVIGGEAVPGAGGELREQREPVAADKGPAPFHRTAGGEAKPADQQRPGGWRSPEYALLGGGRHDPADILASSVHLHARSGREFVVKRGVREVGLQERRTQIAGQPDGVERQGLAPRLGDHRAVGDPGTAAPFGDHHAVGPQFRATRPGRSAG